MTRYEFRAAFEDIVGLRRGQLKDGDSRGTVEGWSSLADAQIVAFISSQSGAEADAELMEAETFGDMTRVLGERGFFAQ